MTMTTTTTTESSTERDMTTTNTNGVIQMATDDMSSPSRFSTVEETLKHAAFLGVVWDLEPHSSGKATVASSRGGPLKLAWEIHGSGPIKVVVSIHPLAPYYAQHPANASLLTKLIMGLAGVMATWQRQTLYLGHERGHRFSVLLLDNRGVGLSDRPFGRYSTSEMARDVMEVLDQVGWTDDRQLHVIGISLGGMISQELACLMPKRLASLSLISTAGHLRGSEGQGSTSHFAQLVNGLGMLRPRSEAQTIMDTARRVFTPSWLSAPDTATLPTATTPRCRLPRHDAYPPRFTSNFQRYQAQELVKRRRPGFSRLGYLYQGVAAVWHYKTEEQLRVMADAVGRRRIMVVHGREDAMIRLEYGIGLVEAVEPAVVHFVDGAGHAPCIDREGWFNNMLEQNLEAWNALGAEE
ncbi:glycylpeptide N-tetradecanoyltransferase [Ophiocordyceps camponoti-floridani]|uniref:Glycylpeptide N-tetradecanoyltransferase n=1 Tax=Ophiocordyceps camponoti-floridani TaxID=2030778 RepID=A0A8H4VFC4_9HYPO|nr:glycylpeptide N-tetradecanoyltransferase [Ophiocordyceps camponoti-floridani]